MYLWRYDIIFMDDIYTWLTQPLGFSVRNTASLPCVHNRIEDTTTPNKERSGISNLFGYAFYPVTYD